MNKAQIIEMAGRAGMEVHPRKGQIRIGSAVFTGIDCTEQVERFAQLVADHALEDAARTCEARAKDAPAPLAAECLLCAVAIRAMKGNP